MAHRGYFPVDELATFRWGLVPFWAKDPSIGNRMINARAETVAEKPAFRAAYRHRRCLVLADGFYEWHREGSVKTPYYISSADGQPFAAVSVWCATHPGCHYVRPKELFEEFDRQDRARVIFIHMNHTNPLLFDGSEEQAAVEQRGFRIAREGMRLEL